MTSAIGHPVRTGVAIEPILFGAGHEHGVRPGTESLPRSVALGEAARRARRTLRQLRDAASCASGGSSVPSARAGKLGARLNNMRRQGRPVDAGKTFTVAGWAPVGEGLPGEPAGDVAAACLRAKKTVKGVKPNTPQTVGADKKNPAIAADDG